MKAKKPAAHRSRGSAARTTTLPETSLWTPAWP